MQLFFLIFVLLLPVLFCFVFCLLKTEFFFVVVARFAVVFDYIDYIPS